MKITVTYEIEVHDLDKLKLAAERAATTGDKAMTLEAWQFMRDDATDDVLMLVTEDIAPLDAGFEILQVQSRFASSEPSAP